MLERVMRGLAGLILLASLGLALAYSWYWLILTGLVALNLSQSAITNWCPAMVILKSLGVKSEAELALAKAAKEAKATEEAEEGDKAEAPGEEKEEA